MGNAANNLIKGGDEADHLDGAGGDDTLIGGNAEADPEASRDDIYGGEGNDYIYGNGGNDFLYGDFPSETGIIATGHDWVFGGKDNDYIFGNLGNDSLFGNAGDDTVIGDNGTLNSADGADLIFGGQGNDIIVGNGGNDTLYGNKGNDTMYGGAGDDTFVFQSEGGVDSIASFDSAGAEGGDILLFVSNLNNSGIVDFASLSSRTTFADGNATIDLSGGHSVTIAGISTLAEGDVSFG